MKIGSIINGLGYAGGVGIAMVALNSSPSPDPTGFNLNSDDTEDVIGGGAGANQSPVTGGEGSIGEEDYGPYTPPGDGEVSQTMAGMVGEDTSGVAGTENGNKACAYAVNEAIARSTGQPILSAANGGYAVNATTQAMRNQPDRFQQVTAAQAVASGRDYVVSSNPAWGSSGSHIGIGSGSTVWSNSSSGREIRQNYTASSWGSSFGTAEYYIIK